MPYDLSKRFVIAVSSRALFDANRENQVFETQSQAEYNKYQRERRETPLDPGVSFGMVRALLALNDVLPDERKIEVILLSRNSPAAGLRVMSSIRHHGLDITRSVFTTGEPVSKYLNAYSVDLFLSANTEDVQSAYEAGFASAMVYGLPKELYGSEVEKIRLAFDGDSVLFSDESERIYQSSGVEAFHEHEDEHKELPLKSGPFAKTLLSLAYLQRSLDPKDKRIEIALITARNAPSDQRVLNTLESWGIELDQTFFTGGMSKELILKEYRPHIFFDDQPAHCITASYFVPTAQVPSNLFTLMGVLPPECPGCGAEMVKRSAARGVTAGKAFWGCSNFPQCRKTVSLG
jgi:5'-nucleotidase